MTTFREAKDTIADWADKNWLDDMSLATFGLSGEKAIHVDKFPSADRPFQVTLFTGTKIMSDGIGNTVREAFEEALKKTE